MTITGFNHQPHRFAEGLMTETYSLISKESRERDPILAPPGANRLDGDDVAIGFDQHTGDSILRGNGAIGTKRGVQSAVTIRPGEAPRTGEALNTGIPTISCQFGSDANMKS
jgi:hypothetical protein